MVEQSCLITVVYVIELVTIDDRWNSLLPIIDGHRGNIGSFHTDETGLFYRALPDKTYINIYIYIYIYK